MDGFADPPNADREFEELRERAYRPDPDIRLDPPALARSPELEAAYRAEVEGRGKVPGGTSRMTAGRLQPAEEGVSRSIRHRATALWRRPLVWTVAAAVIAGGFGATALFVPAPPPEATLHPIAVEADRGVRRLVDARAFLADIDTATLRAYGSYFGLEIWSGTDAFDSPCLVAVHRASGKLAGWRCAPADAHLILDVSSSGDGFEGFDGLAGNGIIRFMLRGDAVDAYVHVRPEAD